MTDRSERLEKYLREKLGWNTQDYSYRCKHCETLSYIAGKFCKDCGNKLKVVDNKKDVCDDLEKALKHALEENE